MRQRITTALEVVGMTMITSAAAWTSLRLGLLVGGVCALTVGIVEGRE